MKRFVPTVIAMSVGILVLLSRFITNAPLDTLALFLIDTAVILGAFALLVGFFNVLGVHGQKIQTRQPGWRFSFILICFALFVLAIGLPGPSSPLLQEVFKAVQYPLQATVASLLIFFVASAAFRALRVHSVESMIMVTAALVVLIGQMPFSEELRAAKDWILTVPGLAGVRGLILGVALGTIITGLRVLLGIHRPYSS